jgi:hypothetical protein
VAGGVSRVIDVQRLHLTDVTPARTSRGHGLITSHRHFHCGQNHRFAGSRIVAQGSRRDPDDGWLRPVQAAVLDALTRHPAVSAEITGAWDSDDTLVRDVRDAGHRLVRVWIIATLEETLARLRTRTSRKVSVSETEARSTRRRAVDRARAETWDATIEASGAERSDVVKAVLQRLIASSA